MCAQPDHMSGSLEERRGLGKDESSKLPSYNLGPYSLSSLHFSLQKGALYY